jgi:hypothetical protein
MHIHIPDGVLPAWLWISGYLYLQIRRLHCLGVSFNLGVRRNDKVATATLAEELWLAILGFLDRALRWLHAKVSLH